MLSRSEDKLVRSLSRRKGREEAGLFLVEGLRVVEELLATGIVLRFAVTSSTLEDSDRGRALKARLESATDVKEVGAGVLNELSETSTNQGVLVVAEIPEHGLSELVVEGSFAMLVVDGVQDPGNLGTLVRTAVAFGCGAVVSLPGTVDAWNPKVVRASAGMLFRLPVLQAIPKTLMEWLRERDFMVLGADAEGRPLDRLALPRRVALVVGNEGGGLSGYVRSHVDGVVAVPMAPETESLNVAVAAGILLYVITRERR